MNFVHEYRDRIVVFGAIALFVLWASARSVDTDDVKNASLAEAKALIDAGAIVIDVRSRDAFEHRRIPGALPLPLELLGAEIPASIVGLMDKPVIVYCNEGTTRGPTGTALLNKAGFSKAVNLSEGIEGWDKAGLPVKRGK